MDTMRFVPILFIPQIIIGIFNSSESFFMFL